MICACNHNPITLVPLEEPLELTKFEQYGFTPGTPTDQEVKHVESTDDLVLSGPAYEDETGSAHTDTETGERWVLCWARMPNNPGTP